MLKKTALLMAFGAASIAPVAAEPLNYNVVTLSASARESIKRDTMEVVLSIRESGRERMRVNNAVTERSNRVLQQIRANKKLESELSSRNAYPYYIDGNPKKAQVWQDEARITVRSKDFEALSKLIAAVQNDAAVSSLDFTVSSDLQDKTQKSLTDAAIRNFREQAQNITRALGASTYKIVTLDVNSGGYSGYRMDMMARSKGMSAVAEAAAIPEVEAGNQEIQMNVSGSIQVQ